MEKINVYELIRRFNKSEIRKNMIPQELVSGWPSIRRLGKTLCLTIPYYGRQIQKERVLLYPLFCSVTVPVGNPDRVMDFTIYPHQKEWKDVDYQTPAGVFKHKALADVKTKAEYDRLCLELYGYFDSMVDAVRNRQRRKRWRNCSQSRWSRENILIICGSIKSFIPIFAGCNGRGNAPYKKRGETG